MNFTRVEGYLCSVVLAVAVVGGVFYLDAGQRQILQQVQNSRSAFALPPPTQSQKPPVPPMPTEVGIGDSPVRGSAAAKIVMVEFSDFQCPYCGRYERDSFPRIDRDYVTTGKVRYVWRNYPLQTIHPEALNAAGAAECARRSGRFWEMHAQLFSHQDRLDLDLLPAYAKAAGVDSGVFRACLDSGEGMTKVTGDQADAASAGVTSAPYFFFGVPEPGGKIRVLDYVYQGAVPFSRFQEILDKLLAAQR
jgi:protein-disulfide isomerase